MTYNGLNDEIAELAANAQSGFQSESAKQKTEFVRYKQDCRKRALEMAHGEFISGMQPDAKISIAPGYKVTDVADGYYKWLISIPE